MARRLELRRPGRPVAAGLPAAGAGGRDPGELSDAESIAAQRGIHVRGAQHLLGSGR